MMNKFKKQMKNEKGLTLIELLAVIVILAIIAAIAVPAIGNIITNSKVNALKADGQNVLAAANLYFIENNTEDEVTLENLTKGGFLEDAGGFSNEGAEAPTVKKVAADENGTTGNTISGTAANGSIKVAFTNATNAMITAADVKDGGDGVEVIRK